MLLQLSKENDTRPLKPLKKKAGSTFCDKSISKTKASEAFSIGSHTAQWGGQSSHKFIRSVNNVEPHIYIYING